MVHAVKAWPATAALVLALGAPAEAPGQASAQPGGHQHGPATPSAPKAEEPSRRDTTRAPVRATPEELHRQGGIPRGWKFAVPPGDPARGRQLFADLECYKCHAVRGEGFPATSGDGKNVGPDLTGMGGMHPAEYLAESVLAPNHVIVLGSGFTGGDGLSIMPSYADSLSLAQWVDLVAYLRSLTAGGDGGSHAGHGGGEIEREGVAGDYRVRLVYAPASREGHEHGAAKPDSRPQGQAAGGGHEHHGAHPQARPAAGAAHLMAFVLDRETDEPVPYLPVTVTLHVPGAPPRSVRLGPMVSDRGFHYGADLTLPAGTERLAVGIGTTSMRVMGTARSRFTRPATAVFDWAAK